MDGQQWEAIEKNTNENWSVIKSKLMRLNMEADQFQYLLLNILCAQNDD